MKKSCIPMHVLGIAAALCASQPALAGSQGTPGPAYNWAGLYLGINGGGAWDTNTSTPFYGSSGLTPFFLANEFPNALLPKPNGGFGGGQIGYNKDMWSGVVGIEADIQASGYEGTAYDSPTTLFFAPFTTTVEAKNDWFGTLRARAGYLGMPNLLLFATGGLAFGKTTAKLSTIANGYTLANCPGTYPCTEASASSTQAGWTVGAGVEYMASERVSVKAEYLYMDLGSQAVTGLTTVCDTGILCRFTANTPFRENIVRAGVNLRFHDLPFLRA